MIYNQLERWFINIDFEASCKKEVSPVKHRMHHCKVEYKEIQRPGGCDIIMTIVAHKGC
jgi:hypothetical protein